jgi:outer membrane receptor protein involved in Fe transport
MIYGLISKGNKPADYNDQFYRYDIIIDANNLTCPGGCAAGTLQAQQQGLDLVKEETQWTYEAGFKSAWFDRRVTANVSGFFIDWDNQAIFIVTDIQTVSPTSTLPTTIRQNAGRTEIWGLEIESNYFITENLFLIANYGYNNGEFKEGFDSNLAALTGGDGNLNGKEIPNSPEHSVILGLQANTQINGDLEGFMRADYIYESERWNQSSNLNKLGDRKLLNLRFGVDNPNWRVSAYVNNVLDDNTPFASLNFVDFASTLSNGVVPEFWSLNPSPGRNYGLELTYRFGG